MGERIKRPRAAEILGCTVGGLTHLRLRGLVEHRDAAGPYYDRDEVEAWKVENGYTGSRSRHKNRSAKLGYQRSVRRGLYIAKACEMILEGCTRVEILIALKVPVEWIDQAYVEVCESFESAQERIAAGKKLEESAAERKEAERQQRALELQIRNELRARRHKS